VVWGSGFITIGYLIGERIEGSLDRFLLPVTLLIFVISLLPMIRELVKHRRTHD